MLDQIHIRDLLLRCIVGINEHERTQKQDVVVNVEMWVNVSEAVRSDDVSKTVDYKEVNKQIIAAVEGSSYFLIESLASRIADVCLANSKVRKVRVEVDKPGALRFARSVGVELTREKNSDHD